MLPGFSLFQGLAHVKPISADYDSSDISKAYPPVNTEGAFRALNDWKIGNDPDTTNGIPAALSFLKFIGHAYDGSGFGSDGIADGKVSHTFTNLAAGDYSVFMGGSDYLAQDIFNPNLLSKYGVSGTLVADVVPEPETYAMFLAGLGLMSYRPPAEEGFATAVISYLLRALEPMDRRRAVGFVNLGRVNEPGRAFCSNCT
ncbi:PEP-CTERM sorting domain-containing protein [Nitrosospira sp. Is2]|uniref:PEP-CTERM sorting domain-containing protein n=1 Tax=Nitrosospira sp. Is2 TaxID=3080532 RepID=UPI002953D362|nr:PEP-CTERM sorting domain-containing protein [Nitrosospira sp. Is2]WON73387.1 PEP-CTERM sorting domain-containing protein [Nitrosospira sp. Is2]